MRILIVEDNALVALDLEQRLVDLGHEVVGIAATEREAVSIAGAEGADLALMDVALADRSCGVDAAARLKTEFGIPSLFVTATLPDRPEVRRYGLGHLSKPFSEEDLTKAILAVAAVLRGERPPAAPPRLNIFE